MRAGRCRQQRRRRLRAGQPCPAVGATGSGGHAAWQVARHGAGGAGCSGICGGWWQCRRVRWPVAGRRGLCGRPVRAWPGPGTVRHGPGADRRPQRGAWAGTGDGRAQWR
ncbi:hypothetical protein G6F35_018077 [Rhizopus arrhizus]|nr:hypothetical protein G6F35_018077 [Rhizopus arrhizus]